MSVELLFNNIEEFVGYGRVDNQEPPTGPINADDILSELNDESDDKTEDKETDKDDKDEDIDDDKKGEEDDDKADKPEDDDEDKEKEEDELEEPEDEEEFEEKDDLVVPTRKKEILKAYPDLFKKFPYLESAFHLAGQYREILPTIEDAKEAVEKAETLDSFEQDVAKGDLSNIIKAAKEAGEDIYYKTLDNYVESLRKVDNEGYLHVVGNVVRQAIYALGRKGKDDKNDDLLEAAEIMNEFLFGNKEIRLPGRLTRSDEDPERDKLKKDQEEWNKTKFNDAQNSVKERTDKAVRSTIDLNIDKKGMMSPFIKKQAVREAQELFDKSLKADRAFQASLKSLWSKAQKSNYSSESLDNIRKATLSKSRAVLPDILQRVRNEALKGLGRRPKDENRDRSGHPPVNRSGDSGNRNKRPEAPKNNESTLDYFNRD